MLKVTKYLHLGDLINVLQRYHHLDETLFVPETCKCCGTQVRDNLKALLTLFHSHLKLVDSCDETFIEITPSWVQAIPIRPGVSAGGEDHTQKL